MSDVPFDGWWLADNGRWYPPETHPVFNAPGPMEPPPGWFQDDRGEWRPPHLRNAVVDLSEVGPAPDAPAGSGRRRRRVLAGVWTVVVLGAVGIGVAVVTSNDDEVPTRVGSETTVRELLPPSTMTSDQTTTSTTSTTTIITPGSAAP